MPIAAHSQKVNVRPPGANGGPEGAAGWDQKPCPGVLQSQLYEEEQCTEKLPKEKKNENIWETESK